jgi:hypothetical protein
LGEATGAELGRVAIATQGGIALEDSSAPYWNCKNIKNTTRKMARIREMSK